jgi:arsenate reductase
MPTTLRPPFQGRPDVFSGPVFADKRYVMKNITVYGIKNCDTMKRAFAWLDKRKVTYVFHDYKKNGIDKAALKEAMDEFGWESVINRKGTSWRALSESDKNAMNGSRALKAAEENPSLVKRPLIVAGRKMLLGFNDAEYNVFFK